MLQRHPLFSLLLALLFLPGCAGVRNSYEALFAAGTTAPQITLKVGEKREVLAVGNGFPGWWGYYPGIASHAPEVANITCEPGRSLMPFREPGILFGGERCYVEPRKPGVAWLVTGNKFILDSTMRETDFSKMSDAVGAPGTRQQWIKLTVVN